MSHTPGQPRSLFQLTWPLFIDIAFHFLTGALNTFMVGRVSVSYTHLTLPTILRV